MSILTGKKDSGPHNLILMFDSIIDLVEFVDRVQSLELGLIDKTKAVRDFDPKQEEVGGKYCLLDSVERGGAFYRLIATRIRRVFREEIDPVSVQTAAEA
tara:strand:- start:10718 stop:11017 length:300 start_codon:yes stop_codon:yes gene_type:complete